MKKRLVALALVLGLMLSLAGPALAAGTEQDPLVSLSYLNGTFLEEISRRIEEKVEEMGLEGSFG
ncbi:MAG: S-layer homology domain-containing protein, partial [Clostridia bacterium]|nr:S-layer homology domain-containing protein [Clostridia bacterium]